ncbi:peptidase S8 and DUF1034 (Fn-like) domain protein [Metarhizium robertsii]|uniref:Peptidase S8, subtilisin, Asp-active site protein n=2 Tax=Metarhizium robertsii TaxID=568076 RepID=E9F8A0_METRA|nr:Peptidase S8, subtilisin, Asp-active site protein [Metarhizium robertsii ARSEF 23]EFY96007.1 Peptidase S8, subtilisin, Asp-active site protein [Metarhizium robertsii ARSEF 23]EXU99232.1 peptidase S8 and DUF1034 (Fn-like) domain protein [Metarhizium robertsii]
MVRLSASALACLAAATVSFSRSAVVHAQEVAQDVVAGAFLLECDSQSLKPLIKTVQEQGGEIRREFNSEVFYGFSAQLSNASVAGDELQHMPGVKKVWQVQVSKHQESPPAESQATPESAHQRRQVKSPWNHVMTQIDKLHAAGFTGSGIRIAVVDSGVDYTHPALGGCFGEGCRVALGGNFAKDGKDNDPMDCNGHGTAVAGIVAGNDANYVGVAPNATLAGYRVLDCSAMLEEDDLIAGWVKAYQDGAQIIVSSAGWPGAAWATRPAAAVVSRIVDSGVPCIVGLGNENNSGLFNTLNPSSGRGVTSVNAFARAPGAIDGHVTDAPVAQSSTFGPNWDLEIKPTVGAPGDDVPGIKMGGGYEDITGTSFAGPLVAGILALVAEVRGTFDPVLLNSLLMTTAVPQGNYYSVAQQGGGLARAWDAAHATTLIEPGSLSFNDTLHRADSLSLRITNTARVKVTYHLDTLAAKTIYTLENGGGMVQHLDPPVDESADVKLSRRLLVLGPGESASVDVSATDPKGLDPERLPVWSGWISIQSSSKCSNSSSVLTVPYLGVSGSMKEHQVLRPDGVVLSTLFDNGRDHVHPNGHQVDYETKDDSSVSIDLPVRIKPILGTRLVRAEVVPLSPRKWLAARLADKNLKLDAFSLEALTHAYPTRKTWSGRLESGDYIPAGKYNLVVRALRLFGDAAVASDWDLSENVSFEIIKPAGRKACERYESSKGAVPADALFTSLEECLQVHGDKVVDAPWVPAPQDEALRDRCANGELTDELCGTYELCRKHSDIELLSDVKSPFTSLASCIESHKTFPFKPFDYSRLQECMANQDDESICGTDLWCNLQYESPQPTDEYGSSEECRWAHGSYR